MPKHGGDELLGEEDQPIARKRSSDQAIDPAISRAARHALR